MRNVSISHVGLVFLLAYASSAQAQGYSFTGLGDLPNGTSWNRAYGISADGLVVVGTARTDSGREAFRWTRDEGMVSLGDLPGGEIDASAEAASADGSVIVGTGRTDVGWEAFCWTQETGLVGLGVFPDATWEIESRARDVSADGNVIVGESGDYGAAPGRSHAFRWTQENGMVRLGELNDVPSIHPRVRARAVSSDGSVVVGYDFVKPPVNGYEAFRWTEQLGMKGLGHRYSQAYGVSADGLVAVGKTYVGDRAMRWVEGAYSGRLASAGGAQAAYDASADGSVIVGTRSTTSIPEKAMIWSDRWDSLLLDDILIDGGIDLQGWTLWHAEAVSDDGTVIAGWGINPAGRNEAWIATIPVPEPATMGLLTFGSLALLRRRRRQCADGAFLASA